AFFTQAPEPPPRRPRNRPIRKAGNTESRFSGFAILRRSLERKRAALCFVTGWWPERESPGARHGVRHMATAVQKITLASSRDIPCNKLRLSKAIVRRAKAGISVAELAESIARRGLIQSLHVRPVLDAEGKETGMFEVPAGGRRYRALELLVRQKRLAKTAPV